MIDRYHSTKTSVPNRPPLPEWHRHALFLDFDGTLTPIVARPEDVRVSRATHGMLKRMIAATDGAVAVVSGRALEDLMHHLGDLPIAMSGSHGLEYHLAGQSRANTDAMPSASLGAALSRLEPLARDLDVRIERKPGAVALHYRNRPDSAAACRDAVERVGAAEGLRILHGNMVSEAVLPDVDKGRALRSFLTEPPFSGRLPVMVGDDTTDEDAFRTAQEMGGFGVRIGAAETAAKYQVDRMEDALDWLEESLCAGTTKAGEG